MNDTLYVDASVRSTSHLDYAVNYGCGEVLCIVPLDYQGRPNLYWRLLRRSAVRVVERELARIGQRAQDVLIIQPPVQDLAVHGTNVLRGTGTETVAERSYAQTRRLLTLRDVAQFVNGLAEHPTMREPVRRSSEPPGIDGLCGRPLRRRGY
jgi:hypothetical protein